ncbi:FHA domain-containing protein [Varibaculum prostatecancerukia]|uniref:FHA domain-containing protein n=1 Tax=Varibaculum prostatecancerukia TaxID=2811781 RepID=UPI001C00162A|nr:FHA domain-containing protein [Varibaculum prostatecancerukia]
MSENDVADPLTTAIIGAIRDDDLPGNSSLSEDARNTIAQLPEGSALLVVVRGPNLGARFLLNAEKVSVGRKPKCDIFLDDVTVSRKHAIFVREGTGYVMRDAGSLNGTYVNRERVDSAQLKTGDIVQIGKYRMVYYSSRKDS